MLQHDRSGIKQADRVILQRFEAKYRITAFQALAIQQYVMPHVSPDPHGNSCINTLYLDSPALRLYASCVAGEKNRLKLRVRKYGDAPAEVAFCEIKRRISQIIRKTRVALRPIGVQEILARRQIDINALVEPTAKAHSDLHQFKDLMDVFSATPRVLVRYSREAFGGRLGEPVRLTFDRRLSCRLATRYASNTCPRGPGWCDVNGFEVIFEVKFTNTFPEWVADAIRRFQLVRQSVSKYALCVDALRRAGYSVGDGAK